MKIFLLAAVIFAMATIAMTRNATWGKHLRGDKVVLNQTIIAYPQTGRQQEREIKYNPWFFKKVLTVIWVTDNFRNVSGPEVEVIKGGVGQKFATIKLRSQNSQGINATVLFYGK